MMTCINGSHATHADGKGNSGLFSKMEKVAMINVSKKLGLVTTSSTETEVVSTGEMFSKCAWFRRFRMDQGDVAKEDVFFRGNKSETLLHLNYSFSIGKGTKHVNFR